MNNIFLDIVFTIFTVFLFGKIISYCLYEIKIEKNPFGGLSTIVFSFVSIIFVNIMVWIN